MWGSAMKARIFILPGSGAGQRVDLVDAVDELSPAFAQSAPGSRLGRLTLGPGPRVVPGPVRGTNPVGAAFTGESDEELKTALGTKDPSEAGFEFEPSAVKVREDG
jgi:hypothetical protein